ncbi:MAG: hypothetical protein KAH05_05075, partial [Clostridiales bacterium]|nr:hypothetical protein [Clostridiales bacterium]
MQNLFITDEDVFEAQLFVAEDSDGLVYCDITKAGVKFLLEDKDLEIEHYVVTFKKPSFGDIVKLTEIFLSPISVDATAIDYQVNPIDARLKTMSCLIKKWNFLDNSGNTIRP